MEKAWDFPSESEIPVGKVFLIGVTRGTGRPLHLITTKDMGRVAAYVLKHLETYIGRAIGLAGDVLTPKQMAAEFSRVQGSTVVHQEVPPWLFLLLFRKSLFDLIWWYRTQGYQANVEKLRQEFPGLLTTFRDFLEETQWAKGQ